MTDGLSSSHRSSTGDAEHGGKSAARGGVAGVRRQRVKRNRSVTGALCEQYVGRDT
jgi:hypothetical protein